MNRRRHCEQCGKHLYQLPSKLQTRWLEERTDLCPRCIDKWLAPHGIGRPTPRCAGCGTRTTALTGDRCAGCIANGVEVISLFDQEGVSA